MPLAINHRDAPFSKLSKWRIGYASLWRIGSIGVVLATWVSLFAFGNVELRPSFHSTLSMQTWDIGVYCQKILRLESASHRPSSWFCVAKTSWATWLHKSTDNIRNDELSPSR